MKYATERWSAVKSAALEVAVQVKEARAAAVESIKARCGQDAFTMYEHPWTSQYESIHYSILFELTPGKHWPWTIGQVAQATDQMRKWANPEAWEATWAEKAENQ